MAVLSGWFTAEVGRQPWVVYGLLRTADAVTPSLRTGDVLFSLAAYVGVYGFVMGFGIRYLYRLLRAGPQPERAPPEGVTSKRPMALATPAQD